MERDYPNALENSYLGISEGLPKLLEALEDLSIVADFFVSREIVQRFPLTVGDLEASGHNVGNHGTQHDYLCTLDYSSQLRDIEESSRALGEVLTSPPSTFRAPQFGADGNTIMVLEKLEYKIDSSVLPGRLVKKRPFGRILDFTRAPRRVYSPSRQDVSVEDGSSIVEVPLTENPEREGTPIGMGFLNSAGVSATLKVCKLNRGDYVTFLIHPWECVDLLQSHPDLPGYLANECSSDLSSLRELLERLSSFGQFVTIPKIVDADGGVGSR